MIPQTGSRQAGQEETSRRTDILKPLIWPLGLSLTSTVSLSVATGLSPLTYFAAGLATIFAALYVGGYIYFGIKSPDALRSESYTLRKMAIERGMTGDSAVGLYPDAGGLAALPAADDEAAGAGQGSKK